MNNNPVWQIATLIIPLVIAIVFHEVAHGWVARWLGDPTAHERRRLSFNPLRHVDPVGTLILPGMLALVHAPVFGWAKPVPVDARRLPHPKRDMMIVGAAGPAMNLLLALVAALAIGAMTAGVSRATLPATLPVRFVFESFLQFLSINLFLAIFNLLPIPPFDGSHIVQGLLPPDLERPYARLRRYALPIMLLLLVVLPMAGISVVDGIILAPVDWATDHYLALARLVAEMLGARG